MFIQFAALGQESDDLKRIGYYICCTYAGNAFVTCNLGVFRVANCETVKEDVLQLKL